MKWLGIVGTAAMLLVGGGIYAHYIKPIEHFVHNIAQATGPLAPVVPYAFEGVLGLAIGAVAVAGVQVFWSVAGDSSGEH
jgi:predicted DNA repair protein MutK